MSNKIGGHLEIGDAEKIRDAKERDAEITNQPGEDRMKTIAEEGRKQLNAFHQKQLDAFHQEKTTETDRNGAIAAAQKLGDSAITMRCILEYDAATPQAISCCLDMLSERYWLLRGTLEQEKGK